MAKYIAVIGGGPAGCHAAYLLHKQGYEVVLFERDPSIGGRTCSWQEQGWAIDSGAGFVTNFYSMLWPLVNELGLLAEMTNLSRSNALTNGQKTVDFTVGSVSSFLSFPFLGTRDKFRMAWQAALITARHQKLDLSRPETLASWDDRSVRDEALHLFGEEVYQYLVRPSIEPFWYFSCTDVSRAMLLGLMAKASTAKFFAFKRGMSFLCQRLVAGVKVHVNAPIDRIARDGKLFLLQGEGSGRTERRAFDGVVLATTATAAHKLTSQLDDHLVPAATRNFLSSQTYVPNVHVAFLTDDRASLPPMSSLFPCGPHRSPVAAINFNSHKQQSRPSGAEHQDIIGVFLNAQESQNCLSMQDDELSDHAWRLARELCPGLPAQSRLYQLIKRPEAIPLHSVGRYRQAVEALNAQQGPVVFAGDYLASATVDGALYTGLRAAQTLAKNLSQ
ncbi:MAG TPA: FAD-dependent oxidoreductase [Oligoflexus sp.]|uniref:protoporphyrinogen/coproporphyrinogen oxidase n=1 Tax=Oligoflexus sp. TaxID=1971216 RepID=UPI002D353697|nr:FAD-dependent oxidoreductase [Oligoflexus sp.]HYX36300.1 FAD-dependent oxidoreductase [Oligoflexus sp.]